MTISLDEFRAGMRRLAASVTVIATRDDSGNRHGLTATAICSVTGDPPTLLCCINRANQSHDPIVGAGRFSINILAATDEELASRFAAPMPPEERFARGSWRLDGSLGVPVLESAAAWFACRIARIVGMGSHSVLFGEIEESGARGDHVMPLLYAHGGYGRFGAASAALNDFMWSPDWQVYD